MLSHMRHQSSFLLQRLIGFLVCIASLTTIHAQDTVTYIKAGKLFDGRSDKLQDNVVIVVQGKTILRVGKDVAIPAGANVLDLRELVVMPGLIDAHTHIVRRLC